jgi:hypothetical protein
MATNDRKILSVKFVAEGIDTVQRQINDLGSAGVNAAQRISSAFARSGIGAALATQLNALKLKFADVISAGQKFGASWAGVQQKLNAFTSSISSAITRILKFKAALGLATAGVIALFKSFGSNAERITQTSSALGVTTDQYQRLAAAARDVGVEQDALDRILAKFTVGVEKAGDEADKASNKNKKLAGSIEQVAVKAQDGSTKIVTIRRGIQDASDATDKFNGITQTGVEGMLAYAKSVAAAGSTTEQLAKVANDFGQKQALQVLTFMRNLTFQFDDAARAAAGLIQPLSDVELALGLDLDTSFDNLATNLLIIRDRLLAVFSPAMTKAINYFTHLIKDNEQLLITWATELNTYVLQIVDDFINAMAGANDKVKNKWIIDLIEGSREFGKALKYVFFTVVPEAFKTLRRYAQTAADQINKFFGTDFTGDSLLIAIGLGYISGAFGILTTGLILAIGTIGLAARSLVLLSKSIDLVFLALRPVAFLLGYLGAALATLIGAPAWVGIAIVGALIIAGGLIYAYWDDIKVYAAATWDAIVDIAGKAIASITAKFGSISTEWSAMWEKVKSGDWSGLYKEIEKQTVDFWTKFIADTKRDVELINQALAYIGIDLPAVWEHISNGASAIWDDIVAGATDLGARLEPAWQDVKDGASKLWTGVEATAKSIWDNVARIISAAAGGIADAVSAVWTAASEAISGATGSVLDTATSILDSINQALTAAGDVQGAIDLAASLVKPFSDAKDQITQVWTDLKPILEAKGAELVAALSSPLASLTSLPDAFSVAANAIPNAIATAIPTATATMQSMADAIVGVALNLSDQVRAALASFSTGFDLSAIVSAFQNAAQAILDVWGSAMRGVATQTSQMVSSVQMIIAQLVAYLQSLRAAIAAAQSQASSGRREGRAVGGYITGPGTGTSDSIPLWGSNGEFMLKARAVKYWGLDVLYALNNMRMPKFAMGGLIGDMAGAVSPRGMARPLDGAGGGLTPYTLVFEGKQYPGFKGPSPDALRQIGKARIISRIASNNRVPKWKG